MATVPSAKWVSAVINSVNFQKMISAMLLVCLALTLCIGLCSCRREESDKIKIVCASFVEYDWLCNIVGESERVELSLIVKNGSDIHNYQPTAADIMQISECDMIVYLGNEFDTWVNDALTMAENEQTKKFSMSECEGVTLREISSASEHHGHEGEEHEHEHDGHNHGTADEHLWLSINNAIAICRALSIAICELDGASAQIYTENTEKYIEELTALDAEYRAYAESVADEQRFMLFCDRFPFVYLLCDYEIDYIAAFEGCSADANSDFATVVRLIEELEAHSAKCVFVCEDSDSRLAQTVILSSNVSGGEIFVMDSLQAVSQGQIESGASYLGAMRENLEVIKAALGAKN